MPDLVNFADEYGDQWTEPRLESLSGNKTKEEIDANSHYVFERVVGVWKWAGLDFETAMWLRSLYRSTKLPVAGPYSSTTGHNVQHSAEILAGESVLVLEGFHVPNDSGYIPIGTFIVIKDDRTIYRTIKHSHIRGNTEITATNVSAATGLAWTALNGGWLYYTRDGSDNKICRCRPAGGSHSDILTGLTGDPKGIAIDAVNSKIYWCEITANKIRMANLDGSSPTDVLTGLSSPTGIRCSPTHFYWTSVGDGKIKRAELGTGANVTDIIGGLSSGPDLCLDLVNSYIYVVDSTAGNIVRTSLTGTGTTSILTGTSGLTTIEYDPVRNLLFYGENGSVRRRAINNGNATATIGGASTLGGMAVVITEDNVANFLAHIQYVGATPSIRYVPLDGEGTVRLYVTPVIQANSLTASSERIAYIFRPTSGQVVPPSAPMMYDFIVTAEYLSERETAYGTADDDPG